jgi:hypothetical protein
MSSDPVLLKLNEIAEKVTRIETSLFPDGPLQPGRLAALETKVAALEGWRNTLVGGWFVLSAGLARKFLGH